VTKVMPWPPDIRRGSPSAAGGFWAVEVKGADDGVRDESAVAASGAEAAAAGEAANSAAQHDPDVSARGESNVTAGKSGAASPAVGVAEPRAPFIGFVGLSVPRFVAHFTSPIAKSRLRRFLPAYERRDFRALPCVEIGWRLSREHWGNGYASEAASACLRFGFEKLTLKQIVALTVPLNKRSIGVMETYWYVAQSCGRLRPPKSPRG